MTRSICHPACGYGRLVEIANDVLLLYDRLPDGRRVPLSASCQRSVT